MNSKNILVILFGATILNASNSPLHTMSLKARLTAKALQIKDHKQGVAGEETEGVLETSVSLRVFQVRPRCTEYF